MKVLHGITGAAGQPWAISRGLRQIGVDADCYAVGPSTFGYKSDFRITDVEDNAFTNLFLQTANEYDVFHFYFRSFLFKKETLIYPTGLDILALKAAGKAVIINFRGSEVRLHSEFKQLSPFNYVDENPNNLVSGFPEPSQRAYRDYVMSVADDVLVADPELQSFVPGASIVPRAIDLSVWEPRRENLTEDNPLVVHAPSRRVVKGTKHVLLAVDTLKKEGLKFRFKLVENLTNEEARKLYESSSIVVDQLRIGWHGVITVEAMALGKPVICYIREDLKHYFGDKPPLYFADPNTITNALRELITNRALRQELGGRAQEYCRAVHDNLTVARQLKDIYQRALEHPRPIDFHGIVDFIAYQQAAYENLLKGRTVKPTGTSYPSRLAKSFREDGIVKTLQRVKEVLKRRLHSKG